MKKIFSILMISAVAVTAAAMPARRGPVTRTAEDGTEKTVFLHGDAFSHHMTDEAGNWLDETTLRPMSAEQRAARQQKNAARRQARRVQQKEQAGSPLNLAPRGLLIMVNFKNKAFTTPADTIHEMINGENFNRSYEYDYTYTYNRKTYTQHVVVDHVGGSARRYFHDVSWGQYNPQFDVVGPYTLSQNYSYYGRNDDANVGYMIKEACELADADGVDFTLYDNNNDGKVDFVYVLYAGYGEADGGPETTVWPHNYDMQYTGVSCTVDGKKVRNYACSNEISYYSDMYNGVGTFCHEFSHVLGLPDLYETNDENSWLGLHTLLEWDILDYGPYNNDGNTPPAYSAYERFFMGWLKPRVLTDAEYVWLNPLDSGKEALIMCDGDAHNLVGNNPNPATFYLAECRTKTGWDEYLPGEGLLITKIKYSNYNWSYNQVNNSANNMGVDLMEAKANTSDYAEPTDAFPAGSRQWTAYADHELSQITLQDGGAVTFSYRGAKPTAIETVQPANDAPRKMLRDGQVVIIRNGVLYDLNGRAL
ncbi:MAG: M6 family metalloprotease domain-containing protein [Paludibacteraceae bacterium]|nr:M6 family metalloprotease domain-containing protein [Paludibacteraceae bacterium]